MPAPERSERVYFTDTDASVPGDALVFSCSFTVPKLVLVTYHEPTCRDEACEGCRPMLSLLLRKGTTWRVR